MRYEVLFPENVDVSYWDYEIVPATDDSGLNTIIAVFEHDDRMTRKHVGYTERYASEWRTFKVKEVNDNGIRKIIMDI